MRIALVLIACILGDVGPESEPYEADPVFVAGELPCISAPFAADASEGSLMAAFGAPNVVSEILEDEAGEFVSTNLFPADPTRRLRVRWNDDASRSRLASVSVYDAGSVWTGPHGLSVGMTIEDAERLNGRPFEILGFGWDYGGQLWDTRGGSINRDIRGCRLFVFFSTASALTDDLIGDRAIMSNDPALRAVRPVVSSITYRYP